MSIRLPKAVIRALSLFDEAGFEAYVVGGCVRDSLMGRQPTDWDITTSALPQQTMAVFEVFRTIETGIQHGTVTVIVDEMPLEITTYRVDGTYTDSRRPDSVSFTPSLTEDLRRRDFTVNAMAYHPQRGLVDPFDGKGDLDRGMIRCVGDAHKRFGEDALRILRGVRFASTLGFAIESQTARAIRALSPTLTKVAMERVTVELLKLLCGENASAIVREYADVMQVVLPGLSVSDRVITALSRVATEESIRLAVLLWDCDVHTAEHLLNDLRISNRLKEDVTTVLAERNVTIDDNRTALLRLVHRMEPRRVKALLEIRESLDDCSYQSAKLILERLVAENACYTLGQLAITGKDLLSAGVAPGPHVGDLLNKLLDAVMEERCENTREALLKYVK